MVAALYQPFPMAGAARAQVWRYSPEFRRPRHFHAEPEINVVARGTGTFGAGESVTDVAAGDLVWWLPGQDHELIDASTDFDLYVIGLTPELSARVLGASLEAAYAGPARVRLAPRLLAHLKALCGGSNGLADVAAVERRVGDLWRHGHALRVEPADRHVLTRRALTSLLEGADVDRADLAHLSRTHPSEVSRHFRRNVGLTLTAYRTRLRLLRFIELADGGAANLLSASNGAGFGSYSQCHRAFQRAFGCGPRRFFGSGGAGPMRDVFAPSAPRTSPCPC